MTALPLPPQALTDKTGNLTPAGMVWFQQQMNQVTGASGVSAAQTAATAFQAQQRILKQKVN